MRVQGYTKVSQCIAAYEKKCAFVPVCLSRDSGRRLNVSKKLCLCLTVCSRSEIRCNYERCKRMVMKVGSSEYRSNVNIIKNIDPTLPPLEKKIWFLLHACH